MARLWGRGWLKLLCVLVILALSGPPAVSQVTGLQITTRTEDTIVGFFVHADSTVWFSSRQEAPSMTRLNIDVNGLVLESAYDAETETFSWDGHGGALTIEAKQALVELGRALEKELQPFDPSTQQFVQERHLYWRTIYWGEAPLGLPLPERKFTRPPVRFGDDRPRTKGGNQACDEAGDDGIWTWSCSTTKRWLEYDSTSRCHNKRVWSGPSSPDCIGRCGTGCPLSYGTYTYDCGDYDQCVRVDGDKDPKGSICGDEYFEMDDDFVWVFQPCR